MSMSQYVAIPSTKIPNTSVWTETAKSLGFDVVIEETDLAEHSGYLPVRFRGRESGFEFYMNDSSAYKDAGIDFGEHDTVIEFVTFSDETEAQCALVCALALLSITGGMYLDSEGGSCVDAQVLAEQAREWISG